MNGYSSRANDPLDIQYSTKTIDMENYQGVKFNHKQSNTSFSFDNRLERLNQWAYLFSQLGLAPVHAGGAYGNHSYRTAEESFIISKAGMIPGEALDPENYCHVTAFEESTTTFIFDGEHPPSSECFLHNILYQNHHETQSILHGHCSLLNAHAKILNIETTTTFYDYGTEALADSALELALAGHSFFILKDHGFVALGNNIKSAGNLTLDYFGKLVTFLKNL
ncbi:MAG: class II aldolase/adducin family protein [Desulfobulbaceae bacterium]|nr:class II aldolase/adducin family protein [Desulfobulbaceae bacterium]